MRKDDPSNPSDDVPDAASETGVGPGSEAGVEPTAPTAQVVAGQGHTATAGMASLLSLVHEELPELEPGAAVGRYLVVDTLGRGGMGVVYRAYDPELDRRVAIKLLAVAKRDRDDVARARLVREGQALAQLSHPNVVGVFDVGHFEDAVFIAMEYVEGSTLGAWIRDTEPSQAQVIDALVAAGRGLQAAHDVGLVHRDVKPGNILVGRDGRVRVADFGIARVATPDAPASSVTDSVDERASTTQTTGEPTDEDSAEQFGGASGISSESFPSGVSTGQKMLATPLTMAGAVIGTPAYMSPEQHGGVTTTERSDQFSYCVAFYEAVYGERPFGSSRSRKYKMRVLAGKIEPAARDAGVPGWLRKILLRGLSAHPGDRFPSMQALLDAIDRGRGARANWMRGAGAVLATAAVVAAVAVPRWSESPCQPDPAALAGVWDQEVSAATQKAFAATARSYASDSFANLEAGLDRYAESWSAMRTQACRATRVDGTQSEMLLDLRMRCLDRRRAELGALGSVLAAADATTVDNAAAALAELVPVDACADEKALTAAVPPPEDPRVRTRVETLQERLDAANALAAAGRYTDAREQITSLASDASGVDYAPLQARIAFLSGRLADEVGDFDAALTALDRALEHAVDAGDAPLIAKAWVKLIWVVGYRQAQPTRAAEMRRPAELALRAAGNPPTIAAPFQRTLGALAYRAGDPDGMSTHFARALELFRQAYGSSHPMVARTLSNLGTGATERADYQRARAYFTEASATYEALLGTDHPDRATPLIGLGAVELELGDYHASATYSRTAIEIYETAFGPDYHGLAIPLENLALAHLRQGDAAPARNVGERSQALKEAALGPEHIETARGLLSLAVIYTETGALDEGVAALERAVPIWEGAVGGDHPDLAKALALLASAKLELDDARAALELAQRAHEMLQRLTDSSDAGADASFVAARATWRIGKNRPAAIERARAALRALATTEGREAATLRQRIEAWLVARGA